MVFVISFSVIGLTLVITVLNPVINRMKDSNVIDEATNNLELIYSTIKEVASEAKGAKRTIPITVTDGVYTIDANRELIQFSYETKGDLRVSGTSGNVYLEPSPLFFDYFNHYQEGSDASETWKIKNGTWKVTGARYYGKGGVAYKNLGKVKDFEISGKIINSNDNIPGEIFVVPRDPEGLVLYLPFDEGTGNVAWDYSGNNNTGTLLDANTTNADGNTPPQWVDGKFGKALSFDGVDDHVDVPHTPILNLIDAGTLIAWVKVLSVPSTYAQIISKSYAGGVRYALMVRPDLRIWFSTGNGTDFNAFPSNQVLELNKWYFIVGTWDGTTQSLYINGALDNSITMTAPITEVNQPLVIGDRAPTYDRPINAVIDEVRIYNRALSEEEIKAEYILGLKKLIKSGTEQISLPNWVNASIVLSSPHETYFDDIVVRTSGKEMKLIVPLRNVDLTGSFRISKGSHQVVIENKGINATTDKPIIEISVE